MGGDTARRLRPGGRGMPFGLMAAARIGLVLALGVVLSWAAPRDGLAAGKCEHTVEKGDTVSRIARKHGISEAHLIKANPALKKNPNRLRVGQTLQICKARRLSQTTPQSCGKGGKIVRHTVGKGETLGGIAAKYAVSRDSIKRDNKSLRKRKNSMIRVGETLRVCTTLRRYTHRSWFRGGIQLVEAAGFHVRRPDNAWGTPAAIASILGALARYRSLEPNAPDVQIGDISRNNGGPLRSHVSHQEGRDVDVGYVWNEAKDGERRSMDLARTWTLLRAFAEDDDVSVIFIDYRLQKRLYEYAESIGVAQERLDALFEYPRGSDRDSVFVHWPGHDDHFHVRFERRRSEPEDTEDEGDVQEAAAVDADAPRASANVRTTSPADSTESIASTLFPA